MSKTFIRPDDGERFTLNDDGLTYSLESSKNQFPDSLHGRWTAEQLVAAGLKEQQTQTRKETES